MMTAAMAVLLAPAVCGCADNRAGCILPDGVELRPGDVVLRRGSGIMSRAVLMADRGGAYSHVGIVADSAGTAVVVHAVPGEPDYDGDPDRVKMETAERFYGRMNASAGCVMRCADSAVAARAAVAAVRVYRRGTLFDHDYDGSDTTRMYCCELVESAYTEAGMPLATGERHSYNMPGLRLDSIMLPSDFRESPRLRVINEF